MYYKEDPRIRFPSPDEPVAHRHDAAYQVGQGKEGPQQCVFLVLDDSGVEHDVLVVCSLLIY